MLEIFVGLCWVLVGVYAGVGAVVAVALHVRGLRTLDPNADGASMGFRVVVTPGLVALWPVMVRKWRIAARGGDCAGSPDKPLTSRKLRALQRFVVQGVSGVLLLVLVALVVPLAVARMGKSPESTVTGDAYDFLEPPSSADAAAVLDVPALFSELPLQARVLEDQRGRTRLELTVREDLHRPSLVLMWNPDDDPADLRNAVFLGAVWGPATLPYTLPAMAAPHGQLVLYSMVDAEVVAAGALTIDREPRR